MDEIFYYSDGMVACGNEGMDKYYLSNPKLIVEVLSPSTEATDRREKLIHYKRVASFEEYVLAAQESPEITLFHRSDNWEPIVLTSPRATAEFRSIGLSLPVAQIYQAYLRRPVRSHR